MLKIATIGSSMITEQFLEAVSLNPDVKCTMHYSRNLDHARDFANKYGIEAAVDSLDDVATSPDVDAVYIASPNACHKQQALQMIAANKHVLVEKPLGINVQESQEIFDAASKQHIVAMEAMRLFHDPAYEVISNNLYKLGTIRYVRLAYSKYSSRYDLVLQNKPTNIFDAGLATGALMDLGVYPLSALVKLFGEPNNLHGSAVTIDAFNSHVGSKSKIDIAGNATAEYKDFIADISYSKCCNEFTPCEICGEKATMQIDAVSMPEKIVIKYMDGTQELLPNRARKNNTHHEVGNMEFELENFRLATEGKYDLTDSINTTLITRKIMDEIRRQTDIVLGSEEEKRR